MFCFCLIVCLLGSVTTDSLVFTSLFFFKKNILIVLQ